MNASSIEQQFILRLPPAVAEKLRERLHRQRSRADADYDSALGVEIQMDADGRKGTFHMEGFGAHKATLVDLPTIVETHKTIDRFSYYKSADIAQMIVVGREHFRSSERDAKATPESEFVYPSGLTPPMKNAKQCWAKPPEANPDEIRNAESEMQQILSGRPMETFDIVEIEEEIEVPISDSELAEDDDGDVMMHGGKLEADEDDDDDDDDDDEEIGDEADDEVDDEEGDGRHSGPLLRGARPSSGTPNASGQSATPLRMFADEPMEELGGSPQQDDDHEEDLDTFDDDERSQYARSAAAAAVSALASRMLGDKKGGSSSANLLKVSPSPQGGLLASSPGSDGIFQQQGSPMPLLNAGSGTPMQLSGIFPSASPLPMASPGSPMPLLGSESTPGPNPLAGLSGLVSLSGSAEPMQIDEGAGSSSSASAAAAAAVSASPVAPVDPAERARQQRIASLEQRVSELQSSVANEKTQLAGTQSMIRKRRLQSTISDLEKQLALATAELQAARQNG